MVAAEKPWIVYILRCADGTLYTGITNDLKHRIARHAGGAGAKYTKGRGPYEVAYSELQATKSLALKREAEIKSLRRQEKLRLTKIAE
jgi:putative endonuclease